MSSIRIRKMDAGDKPAVEELIHVSTNAWYQSHGLAPIFPGGPDSCAVFTEIYGDLDPGQAIVAELESTRRLAGSCFVHPRETHVALGIMNVHPSYFGRGVARRLLKHVTDLADERQLPTRLVSSCLNLDSYSLYTRAGFVPIATYQDVCVAVPSEGLAKLPDNAGVVRKATLDDLTAINALETELCGIARPDDHAYFLANDHGVWHSSVIEQGGKVTGFLHSIAHPGSNMLGPGVARNEASTIALVHAELNVHAGRSPIVLAPVGCRKLVERLYAWGGRNTEMHVHQVRGHAPPMKGVHLPTFMPETG